MEKFKPQIEEEINPEKTLIPEEVSLIFKDLIKGEYLVVRTLEDDEGPYVCEVELFDKLEGEKITYEYMRKGDYGKNSTSAGVIYKTYYNGSGGVEWSEIVAELVAGEWKCKE